MQVEIPAGKNTVDKENIVDILETGIVRIGNERKLHRMLHTINRV